MPLFGLIGPALAIRAAKKAMDKKRDEPIVGEAKPRVQPSTVKPSIIGPAEAFAQRGEATFVQPKPIVPRETEARLIGPQEAFEVTQDPARGLFPEPKEEPAPIIPDITNIGYEPLTRIQDSGKFKVVEQSIRAAQNKRQKDTKDTMTYKYGKFLTETALIFSKFFVDSADFAADYMGRRKITDPLRVALPGTGIADYLDDTRPVRYVNQQWQGAYEHMKDKNIIPFESMSKGLQALQENEVFQASPEWQEAGTLEKLKPKYLPETIMELGPSVLASIGAFAINPTVGMGVIAGSTANDISNTAVEYGVEQDKADLLGLGGGVLIAALERIVPNNLLGKQKGKFISSFTKKLINGPMMEAGTEISQEAIQLAIEKTFRDDLGWDEFKTRTGLAGIGGLLGGTAMSSIATVANAVNERAKNEETPQQKEILKKKRQEIQEQLAGQEGLQQELYKEVREDYGINDALTEKISTYDSATDLIEDIDNQGDERFYEPNVATETKTGEPIIIKGFHGTDKVFDEFKIPEEGVRYTGDGVYFYPEKSTAEAYASGLEDGRVVESYLTLNNPFNLYLPEGNIDWQPGKQVIDSIIEKGHDSIVVRIKDTDTETGRVSSDLINEIVVFDTKQIRTKEQLEGIYNKSKRKPIEVYRGGEELDLGKITKSGISVSPSKHIAEDYVKHRGGKIEQFSISPKAKSIDYKDIPIELDYKDIHQFSPQFGSVDENPEFWRDLEKNYQKAVDWAKENGYDLVKLPLEDEIRVVNPKVIDKFSESKFKQSKARDRFDLERSGVAQNVTVEQGKQLFNRFFDDVEVDYFTRPDYIKIPGGGRAVGRYALGMIEVVENNGKVSDRVIYHEAFHAYMDQFVAPAKASRIRNMIMKEYGLDNKTEAEEWLADTFSDWVAGKIDSDSLKSPIRRFFERLLRHIRGWVQKRNQINNVTQGLFEDILYKYRPAKGTKGAAVKAQMAQPLYKSLSFDDFVTEEFQKLGEEDVDSEGKVKGVLEAQGIIKEKMEAAITGDIGMMKQAEQETNQYLREQINPLVVRAIKNSPDFRKEKNITDKMGEGTIMTKGDTSVLVPSGKGNDYIKRGYVPKIEVDTLAQEAGYDNGLSYLEDQMEYNAIPKTRKLKTEIKDYLYNNDALFKQAYDLIESKKGSKVARLVYEKSRERLQQRVKDVKAEAKVKTEKKIAAIMTDKQKIKRRRDKLRAVRDYFKLSDSELRKINRRDIRFMSDFEFYKFIEDIRLRAYKYAENRQAKNELLAKIEKQQLKNVENYRKALKLPKYENMTTKQLKEFDTALDEFQLKDQFLSPKLMETVANTDLEGVKTYREVKERLAKQMGVNMAELADIPRDNIVRFLPDAILARKNPFYEMMVNEFAQHDLQAEANILEKKKELNTLVRKARKSKPIKERIGDVLAPTDERVFDWLEADDDKKAQIQKTMSEEELDLAYWLKAEFLRIRDILLQKGTLDSFKANYITHRQRTFLEALRDSGLKKAFGEMFKSQNLEKETFDIVQDTGEVLAFEKFFANAMRRKGGVDPTKNVAQAYLGYLTTFENKMALDAMIPKVMAYTKVLTPQGETEQGMLLDNRLDRFVKEWINNKKGRKVRLMLEQGGETETILRGLNSLVSVIDLGFSIPVGVASTVGENYSVWRGLGTKNTAKGKLRRLNLQRTKEGRKVLETVENFTGENPFVEMMTDASTSLKDKGLQSLFLLFRNATYRTNQDFLLGSLTAQEYKDLRAGKLPERLNEIRTNMGRFKADERGKSLFGSTIEGKTLTKYKTWAVPHMYTTLENIANLTKEVKEKGAKEAMKSDDFGELLRGTVFTAMLSFMTYVMLGVDEDDDTFLGKLKQKIARESMTALSALDPAVWLSTPRLLSFLKDLWTGTWLTVTLEEYKTKEGFKGPAMLYKTVVPRFIQGLLKDEDVLTDIQKVRKQIRGEREGYFEDISKQLSTAIQERDAAKIKQILKDNEITEQPDSMQERVASMIKTEFGVEKEPTKREKSLQNLSSTEALYLFRNKIDAAIESSKNNDELKQALKGLVPEIQQTTQKSQGLIAEYMKEALSGRQNVQ